MEKYLSLLFSDMDRLPYFPPPSSPLWERTSNPAIVDISFYDGYTSESEAPPPELQPCPYPLIDLSTWGGLYPPLSSYSASIEEPFPVEDLACDHSQTNWTAPLIDAHTSPIQPPSCLPLLSVPLQSYVPLALDVHDLLEDEVSDKGVLVQEHDVYCCPLLTSDGVRCDALLPCEEALLMAHLRGVHALRAKRVEAIYCPWPGCDDSMQAASAPRHIVTRHIKKRVQCSYCSKSLTRKDGKNKHEKICPAKPLFS